MTEPQKKPTDAFTKAGTPSKQPYLQPPVGESAEQLVNKFHKYYDTRADNLIAEAITTDALIEDYSGRHFSLPLMLYIIRRALDTSLSREDAYNSFIADINHIAECENIEISDHPPRGLVEDLTNSCIQQIQAMRPPEQSSELNLGA